MSDPIVYNPTVPYSTHFHSGIKNGTMFIISGTVLSSADRFSMNFQCGSVENDDIALHFNPRFDEGCVICNTRESNNWGKREEKSVVPFRKGQPFEICILVTNQEYKVSVDKNHFLDYRHRIPLHRVNTLGVMGGISLQRVEIESQGIGFHHHYYPREQKPNSVPFITKLPSCLKDDTVVIINGSILPLADRFSVNFQCGLMNTDDIAFHFNPRFDEGRVICNTRESNNWGQRVDKSELPFCREQYFEIRIIVTNQDYKVYVKGNHFLDYHHRISPHQVNTLAIMGCVSLNSIVITEEVSGFHQPYFQCEQTQKAAPKTPQSC